jgi:hypothetical protein
MMKTLKHIIRGCGRIEGYGKHTGTGWLIASVLIGALLGTGSTSRGPLVGAGAALLIFGPVYLLGAHERAVEAERRRDDFTTGT